MTLKRDDIGAPDRYLYTVNGMTVVTITRNYEITNYDGTTRRRLCSQRPLLLQARPDTRLRGGGSDIRVTDLQPYDSRPVRRFT